MLSLWVHLVMPCLGHARRCVNRRSGAGQTVADFFADLRSAPARTTLKQQGGEKWQQDSGEKLQPYSGDELQEDRGDELQQEGGEELQQEARDVGLKITLFEGAHTTCLFGSALVLGMRCLESGRAPRRIEREHFYCPLTRSWLVTATPPASSWRTSRSGRIRRRSWRFRASSWIENMSPRQFCNEILPELYAEVIDQAELPVRGASWLPEVRKAARRLKQQHLDKIAAT